MREGDAVFWSNNNRARGQMQLAADWLPVQDRYKTQVAGIPPAKDAMQLSQSVRCRLSQLHKARPSTKPEEKAWRIPAEHCFVIVMISRLLQGLLTAHGRQSLAEVQHEPVGLQPCLQSTELASSCFRQRKSQPVRQALIGVMQRARLYTMQRVIY